MLKHCFLILALSCLLGTVSASAAAQDNGASEAQPPAGAPQHGRGHFDPARRAEMLTKQLKLTSEQQPKVLDILKSEQSQMESLHSDSSVSGDDRRAKMMEIHKSTNDQIRAILTPDQQKQFDEMQSRHGQWQGHRPDGQNSAPPPSN